MKNIHMKLAAVPLACLAIIVAGCGGGGGDSAPAATAAAPSSGTTAPAPAPATTPTATSSSALLSGTGDPGADIGKDGDFYLNTTTGMLFGPKANGAWPPGVSVAGTGGTTGAKGDTGAAGNTGTAGNTILSGSVDPTSTVGNNGDYYINTSTGTLFGPKADGTWPPGVPLGGGSPAGGGTVLTGAGAPGNNIGADGDYYLDTNTWTLYGPKANGQWPAGVVLAGQPGSGSGGSGGTGGGTPVGNGSHVLYGSGAPTDSIGADGDFYFDTSTGTLYGPKAGGHWPTTGSTVPTVYNGNFNVPDTLSRGKYVMTGAGGAVPLPSDFGVVIPYDCTRITLTAHTLGKATGTLDMNVYKITGSGATATATAVGNLSCKISNGQQNCTKEMPAGTVNHNDKLQVQLDTNQATAWGGLYVNLACVK